MAIAGGVILVARPRPTSSDAGQQTSPLSDEALAAPASANAGGGGPKSPRVVAWNASRPLECGANDSIVVRGCGNGNSPTSITAGADCSLTLVDCKVLLDSSIQVKDAARLTMQGGEISGPKRGDVLRVDDDARATLDGTKLSLRRRTLRVDGNASLTLKGVVLQRPDEADDDSDLAAMMSSEGIELWKNAELIMEGGALHCRGVAIRQRGTSILLARGVQITAERDRDPNQEPVALRAEKGALALLVDSTLQGPRVAASLDDMASLQLQKTQVRGQLRREANAQVTVTKEAPDLQTPLEELAARLRAQREGSREEQETLQRYGKGACGGIFACYQENFPGGPVNGTVRMRVNDKGKVVATTLVGAIPPKVAACIRELGTERSIPGFTGPVGELVCSYSGTITRGTQMLSINSGYHKSK
jgi:hypothetical protein